MDLSTFVTERVLGEGSFAIVTRLKDKITGQVVAVKTLTEESRKDPDYISWFAREVKIMEALQGHPHVVPLLYADLDRLIIVMPAADQNLFNYIQHNNSALQLLDRVCLFEHILSAMTDAHTKNFLHRDLAPANVLIFNQSTDSVAKVADFGLGKRLDSGSVLTKPEDNHYGRAHYTAPEVLESLLSASKASDVFSLGMILKFVLNGKSPNRKYEGPFAAIVRKATEEEPGDRYKDAIAMSRAFQDMKSVVFAAPDSPKSVAEVVAKQNTSDTINWREFHQVATTQEINSDFDTFLKPVNMIMLQEGAIQSYYAVVGEEIGNFVDAYRKALKNLRGHWDFNDAPDFGKVLNGFFLRNKK